MSYTERKHCDTCEETTIHLKENEEEEIGEECLACGWRDWKTNFKEKIQQDGFKKVKLDWIDCRDGELNKQIVKELTPSEKDTWRKIVYWTNKLFKISQKDNWKDEELPNTPNNQPFDYKPWLFGGGIGIVLGILVGLLINKSNRTRD